MNWLITGGCGFIGRSLVARLLANEGYSIRVYDNLSVGTLADLGDVTEFEVVARAARWGSKVEVIRSDISDFEALVRAAEGADVIVHLAANTGVAPSVEDPRSDCETNVLGTLNVLEAARALGKPKVVFASSGAPLGVQTPPLHEEMAPHPASPYGASKLAGEGYCSAYYHCFGLETVALRFGNVYGPRSGHKMSVVAKFIKLALAGESLEIYGDGKQTRDFIFIDDLVDAIYQAGTMADIGGHTFQIATSSETTVYELTDKLVAALEKCGIDNVETVFGDKRPGDVERNFSDTSKAHSILGWEARTSLEQGLLRTVKYFLN
ncbi:NAD-dependent epimerase/dehydratase family protein [Parahaliea maris]|uniref:NAD-dependent epimerase/dehydratase family protein n=1 Tax=Parahaliea maris TaxID=2716870 RepID=A0A5C8ZT39_9GAMM|nr:NAD-dependent epimerase/dehydratase family protein [Parahaliea maris]TXS90850.1 NAD-dependent epimerase/dehydratase family protein [Parahaliea maris]